MTSAAASPRPMRKRMAAPVGKGRWIFVGLGLWRQVAAGTDGAYQLLANFVSP